MAKPSFDEFMYEYTHVHPYNTDEADWDRAEAAVKAAYKQINLAEPVILRAENPLHAAKLGTAKWLELRTAAGYKTERPVWQYERESLSNLRGGQLAAPRVGYAKWRRDHTQDALEDEELNQIGPDDELVQSCGGLWVHENVAVIMNRFAEIHFDRSTPPRLHNPVGPALAYRPSPDGTVFRTFQVHGTEVPAEWVLNPAGVDPSTALTWQNVEQRRALVTILGWEKVLRGCKIKKLQRDAFGLLFEADIPDAPATKFVKVVCGTGRTFVLQVEKHVKTALEGVASTYGLRPEEYAELEVRT